MAVHFSRFASPRALAACILPSIADQISYRLFSSSAYSASASYAGAITGIAAILLLAKDRTAFIAGSLLYLAYKTTEYYYFSRISPINRGTPLPTNSREAQLAALEGLADQLIPQIEKHLSAVGLYRIPGDYKTIQEISSLIQQKKTLPTLTDPNDIISLFKAQLGILSPRLLQPYYEKLKTAASKKDPRQQRMALILVCQDIKTEKPLLKKIIHHFHKIHDNREQTKMDSLNLANCFTPLLFDIQMTSKALNDLALLIPCIRFLIENPKTLSDA
jgi:hypothetical protein